MTGEKRSQCVLLIDDQETILEMFTVLLERRGYQVIAARTVAGALILWNLNKDEISAVVADTWLSSTESTTELLATFKKERPEVPVIVTSGSLLEADATTQWDRRAINYLPKPFDPIIMLDALHCLTTEK